MPILHSIRALFDTFSISMIVQILTAHAVDLAELKFDTSTARLIGHPELYFDTTSTLKLSLSDSCPRLLEKRDLSGMACCLTVPVLDARYRY